MAQTWLVAGGITRPARSSEGRVDTPAITKRRRTRRRLGLAPGRNRPAELHKQRDGMPSRLGRDDLGEGGAGPPSPEMASGGGSGSRAYPSAKGSVRWCLQWRSRPEMGLPCRCEGHRTRRSQHKRHDPRAWPVIMPSCAQSMAAPTSPKFFRPDFADVTQGFAGEVWHGQCCARPVRRVRRRWPLSKSAKAASGYGRQRG
jgi:hypothetical protein